MQMLLLLLLAVTVGGGSAIWLEAKADMDSTWQNQQQQTALAGQLLTSQYSANTLSKLRQQLHANSLWLTDNSLKPLVKTGQQQQQPDKQLTTLGTGQDIGKQRVMAVPAPGGYLLAWYPSASGHWLVHFKRLATLTLGIGLITIVFFYLGVLHFVVGPVEHVLSVMRKRAAGDRQIRACLHTASEMGQLANWLNRMLDAEEQADARLQAAHADTQEQRTLFMRVFNMMPDIVSLTRLADGKLVDVNDNWERITGWKKAEAIGKTTEDLGIWGDIKLRQAFVARLQHNVVQNQRVQFLDRYGRVIESEASGCIFEERGKRFLLLSCKDIGERLQREQELKLLAEVVKSSFDGVMITDANKHILTVNQAFTTITGYQAEDALGKTPRLLSSGQHDERYYRQMWATIEQDGHWQGEIWNKRKSGELYPQWLTITRLQDDDHQASNYIAVFSDLTERKAAEARIAFLAYHDALTELPNRTLLVDRADQALMQAKRDDHSLALLYLDLDRFKAINDSLGHHIGDELLKAVVSRLKPLLRESDTLCRQGGDEFLILLPHIEKSHEVQHIIDRILHAMSAPFQIDGHRLWISTSIGVACYPEDGDSSAQLLRKADTALYHAKDSGRSTYSFFDRHMDQDINDRLVMETALKDAIGTEQLQLHYQPLMDVKTGNVAGVEALIRWRSPLLGQVSPGRFIPLAEETGLIISLGDWVLETACRQLAAWQQQGFSGVMAVNLSIRQLVQPNFVPQLAHLLEKTGVRPQNLELELTESLMMENISVCLEAVQGLKKLGIHLSIDDFGTGYSSLSYLKRFDVDNLKIDQSFVHGLRSDNSQARPLIRAIVQMAHSLSLKVIAEGVETAEQLAVLRDEGVDMAQGYLFAKPIPANEAEALLFKSVTVRSDAFAAH
ncbi:EAL domain-containing protein [Gallaecimonas sp. GXIMD1310]|uniref:EAL domain-containing protein n=1 Tax=Gallaecimonas sp. GXIMD1310 TaxID=3131926 RepID=UPI0032522F08